MIAFHATPENISPSEGLRGRDLSYTMPSGTHISKVKPVHFSSNPSVASYYGSYKVDDPVQRAYRTGAVRMDQIRRVDPWVLAKTFKPTDTVVLYPCFLNIRRPARDEAGGETHSDAPDGNIWRSPKETRFQVYDVKSDGTQIFHIPYSLGEYRPTPRKKR
jgi:hypothetical protein